MPEAAAPAATNAAPVETAPSNVSQSPGKEPLKEVNNLDPNVKSPSQSEETFDLTVDGKSVKWSRQQMLAYANKGAVADQKFQEAAEMRKDAQRLIELGKKNPIAALSDPALGLSKEQIRDAVEEWYNREYVEPDALSPAELELRDYKAKLEKYQQTEKEQTEKTQRDQEEQLTNQHRTVLQKQIIDALDASGLPKTPFYAARMAFHMAENMKNNWDAPQELIIEQVKNEHNQIFSQMAALPAEEIIKVFGDEFVNKIRAYDLKKLRESRGKLTPAFSANQNDNTPSKNSPKLNHFDVADRLREVKRSGF